jgi:hypothetical protein
MKSYVWQMTDITYRIQIEQIAQRSLDKVRRTLLGHGWRYAGEGYDAAGPAGILLFDHEFKGVAKAWLKHQKLSPEWVSG